MILGGQIPGTMWKMKMMMNRQMYGKTFSSKKEFFKWLEENEDRIDWDYDVELGWYWKDDDE